MGKIRLKITPSLASIVNGQGSDWFVLEKEMVDGATIGDLFTDLASSYADFRKVVFDPETGKVSEQVMVVLNDSLLSFSKLAETKFNSGDTIILLPVYSGG